MKKYLARTMTQDDVDKFHLKHIYLDDWDYNIITQDDDLVGFAAFNSDNDELTQLWVNPNYRRTGAASHLIYSFSVIPKSLLVNKSNQPGRRFYESHNYVDSGERPDGKIKMVLNE